MPHDHDHTDAPADAHPHVFLGAGHDGNERKTWAVIALCSVMMVVEIGGGSLFGSLAVVADGLHMSTHAAAMLIAALAYTYARRHASDPRFAFGTGKLGDLAGFSSALVLAMIALLIGYEAALRLLYPAAIDFGEALPIAMVGLLVNIASAWLLSGGEHTHPRGGEHAHHHHGTAHDHGAVPVEGRPHDHAAHRDNNMRAAFIHVLADAAVSMLAIIGLSAGWIFGWNFLDPVMGLVGTAVIASWCYGLVRDTGAILLDMTPDRQMALRIRRAIETDGDVLTDLHLWRLGPGHLGAIVAVATRRQRGVDFYRRQLDRFDGLSHVTIEVRSAATG